MLLCGGTADLYAYCETSFHLQNACRTHSINSEILKLFASSVSTEQMRWGEKKKRSRHSFHIPQEKHMEETLLDLIGTTSVSTPVLAAKLLFRQITANIQKLSLNYGNSHKVYSDSLMDVATWWGCKSTTPSH